MTLGHSRKAALLLALATLLPFVLGSNHRTSVRRFQGIRDLVEEDETEDGAAPQGGTGLIEGEILGRALDWFVLMDDEITDEVNRGYCAGSLVASNVVMTAAHCIDNEGCPEVVQIGAQFRGPAGGGTFANVVKDSCISHPAYGQTPNRFDVAVFKLDREVPNKVITLNSPDSNLPPPNAPLVAYGFGRFSVFDGDVSDILMKKDQTYLEDCEAEVGASYLSEFMLCSNNASAVCQGDSGGPLVYYQDTGTGYDLEIQVGIASFIFNSEFGCGNQTLTDIWTRVSFFEPWVRENIAILQAMPLPSAPGGGCAQALANAYESLQSWVGAGIAGISRFFGSQ